MSSPSIPGEERSSWLDSVEADAEQVRLRAGIRLDVVVPDLETALIALGLSLATRLLGRGRSEAIYTGHGLALLNSSGLPTRTRFVTAHLLAHHLYGDEPHVEWEVEEDLGLPWRDVRQRRASAFAACLLVGREALQARVPARITTQGVLRLAAEFQVGYKVVLWRLQELGLPEPEGWAGPRDIETTWLVPLDPGGNGVVGHLRRPHPDW